MRNPRKLVFFFPFLLLLLLLFAICAWSLPSSSSPPLLERLVNAEEEGSDTNNDSGSNTNIGSQWQVLTKRNFSTQIRLHPHILLLVTVPWSGESRSLMKEVADLVSNKQVRLGHLTLMVVYGNFEKMLADVLGATEEITLFYYHYSKPFKYQGRLRTQNILSSVFHVMSLRPEEVPLKPLNTEEELDFFFKSTDKAVLLLEFCGWSARLLNNKKDEVSESSLSVQNISENGGVLGENLTSEADGTLPFVRKKYQKGSENQKLTCGVENELSETPWLGEFTQANGSASMSNENSTAGTGMICTLDEFQRFESFFSKFNMIAGENFLPPDRQRFGIISERSMLPFLSVVNPDSWALIIRFKGCPNCSKILQEVDDLKTTLQLHEPTPVVELDVDQNNHEYSFPADRPSIILFMDRSSESLKVREDSNSALEVYRKLAQQYQLSNQMIRGQGLDRSEGSPMEAFPVLWSKRISHSYTHLASKGLVSPRTVKSKDKVSFMIINEGEGISLDNIADKAQDNPAYEILQHLLHQNNPALKTKETKISLLAKEFGFQLLSDDFDVKVVDSLPSHDSHQENGQSSNMIERTLTRPEALNLELPLESIEHSVNVQNGDSLAAAAFNGLEDEKQCEHTINKQNQEQGTYGVSNTELISTELVQESWNEELCSAKSRAVNKDVNYCKAEEFSLLMCQAENSFHLKQELHTADKASKKEHVHHTACNMNYTSSNGVDHNSANYSSNEAVVEGDVAEEKYSFIDALREQQIHHNAFTGSFFFSDGGFQLLRALTAGSQIPSLVIIDPVLQQHYVLPEETDFTYASLVHFVDKYLNGSLTPHRHSESVISSPRETPRPPFVNLDFHEADAIPRVTANTFSELVLGSSKHCNRGEETPASKDQNSVCPWKRDVLVLFSNSWCGFCQRMELVVREVYWAFKNFMNTSKSGSTNEVFMPIQDKPEDITVNNLLSIFYMDCTLNDCSSFFRQIGKRELYPALVLFPGQKEDAVSYEGDMSVVDIIEFIATQGSNSNYLSGYEGILWTQGRRTGDAVSDGNSIPIHKQIPISGDEYHQFLLESAPMEGDDHQPVGAHTSNKSVGEGQDVVIGSVLTATDKLLHASPFDKSLILIVQLEQNEGFRGLILNKQISWDVFKGFDKELKLLKQAPLFYGGPVKDHDLPLLSLSQKPFEGYSEIPTGLFFGDPLATRLAIEQIKSVNQSATDYWFFLGFSSWGWGQLFDELAEGAWNLGTYHDGDLVWPEI